MKVGEKVFSVTGFVVKAGGSKVKTGIGVIKRITMIRGVATYTVEWYGGAGRELHLFNEFLDSKRHVERVIASICGGLKASKIGGQYKIGFKIVNGEPPRLEVGVTDPKPFDCGSMDIGDYPEGPIRLLENIIKGLT